MARRLHYRNWMAIMMWTVPTVIDHIRLTSTPIPRQTFPFQARAQELQPMVSDIVRWFGFRSRFSRTFCNLHIIWLMFHAGANFRFVQPPDSDEQSDSSPVLSTGLSLVPATKLNGVRHSTTNTTATATITAATMAAAEAAAVDDDQPASGRWNSRRKRRANSLTTANFHFANYSSYSSSRISNSSSSDNDDTSSDDNSTLFFSNPLSKRSRNAENIGHGTSSTITTLDMITPTNTPQTSSAALRLERTPSRSGDQKDYDIATPDSGIGSTPGSSTSRWSSA